MIEDGVDLILISGNNSVYTRQNYCPVLEYEDFTLERRANRINNGEVDIQNITNDNFCEMVKIYLREPVRFIREYDDFVQLFKGALYDWNDRSHKAVLLQKNNNTVGYLIIRFRGNAKDGELVEYAGDRWSIYNGLLKLCDQYDLESISGLISRDDIYMLEILKKNKVSYKTYSCLHTLKIVNFVSLMNHLKPYFSQIIDSETLKKLSYSYDGKHYIIRLGNEELKIGNVNELTSLIFGNGLEIQDRLKEMSGVKDFLNTAFPIPIPNVKNLNYI